MVRLAKWTQIVRLGCIFGLFAFAYLALNHTRSELLAAETSRQERDLKAVFQSVETGGSIDPKTTDMARTALSSNALDSQALAQMWLASAGKVGELQSPALLSIAGQVSRRSLSYLAADLLTAAQIEDVPEVVRAFDRMASLSPALRPSLTELAVPLLDDPEGALLIAQRHSRPWFTQFIASAIRQSDRLDQVARLLNFARISDLEIRTRLLGMVANSFLKNNKVAEAQAFAKSFGSINIEFNKLKFQQPQAIMGNSLLTWQFLNPAAQYVIKPNGNLQFLITPGIGPEPIAEKILLFKPGHHRIQAYLEFTGSTGDTFITWRVSCGPVPIPQVSYMKNTINPFQKLVVLEFDAPEQCTGYRLSLVMAAPSRSFDRFEVVMTTPNMS